MPAKTRECEGNVGPKETFIYNIANMYLICGF